MTPSRNKARPLGPTFTAARGFTLIEMAVVVVIVITLMSLGLGVLNSQLASAAQAETKKRQAVIKEALIAHLGTYKRLPCPDVPDNPPGSKVTGKEDRTGGEFSDTSCGGSIGVVPYATLGLSRELALDGWGNFMSYSLPTGSTSTCPAGGDWSLRACFGAAKDSTYEVVEGTVAASTTVASNVLAVIVSHGPNGFAAWAQQGTQNVAPPSSRCEEAHNAVATIAGCAPTDNRFYRGERSDIDDILAYVTRDEAINTLAAQGTLKSVEGQMMEDLVRIRNDKLYEIVLSSGCVSTNPTELDPWGNAYEMEVVEYAPNVCICSKRGSTSPFVKLPPGTPPNPPCSYTIPTTCVLIQRSEVDRLRLENDDTVCPP